MGVSESGAMTARWVDRTSNDASDAGGGIWMSGGGLISDGPGTILLATGNAVTSDPENLPGNTPPGDQSDPVTRLDVQANGTLRAVDFFAPSNEQFWMKTIWIPPHRVRRTSRTPTLGRPAVRI